MYQWHLGGSVWEGMLTDAGNEDVVYYLLLCYTCLCMRLLVFPQHPVQFYYFYGTSDFLISNSNLGPKVSVLYSIYYSYYK